MMTALSKKHLLKKMKKSSFKTRWIILRMLELLLFLRRAIMEGMFRVRKPRRKRRKEGKVNIIGISFWRGRLKWKNLLVASTSTQGWCLRSVWVCLQKKTEEKKNCSTPVFFNFQESQWCHLQRCFPCRALSPNHFLDLTASQFQCPKSWHSDRNDMVSRN